MTEVFPHWNRLGGFVIAGLGFLITRLYVAETTVIGEPITFGFVSLPPLVIGLGLTVYGVILAVGRFSPLYVRTVTLWCIFGIVALVVLLVVTQLGAILQEGMMPMLTDSSLFIGNLLLGGAVVGILIGVRSAQNARKRREIRRTANRAAFVNRLLRHDVINAATIIEGHANLLTETPDRDESVSAIKDAAATINRTINKIGRIASSSADNRTRTVRLAPTVQAVISDLRETYPNQEIQLDPIAEHVTVAADDRLDIIVAELVENAVKYGGDTIRVETNPTPQAVALSVVDTGLGLPPDQRELLTTGMFPEYDDPNAGFGLQAVSLLVERYGGQISVCGGADTALSDNGELHRITVRLPPEPLSGSVADTAGINLPAIARVTTAGLIAGILMGMFLQLTAGTLPIIGALYGVADARVGWIAHLFHSVIFALLFATIYQNTNRGQSLSPSARALAFGLGWGVILWFVAAGFIMPVWLLILNQPTMLPTLTLIGFASHTIWGISLGISCVLLKRGNWYDRVIQWVRG